MSLPSFANETIVVQDPGTRLVHGAQVADWTQGVQTRTYRNCWYYGAETTENNASRQAVMTGYFVLLPPEAVIHETSRVKLPDGNFYQVEGMPKPVASATGNLDHISVYVESWKG